MTILDQPNKQQIIDLAACHECCARIGEPCTFTRKEDPRNQRAKALHSHLDRIQRARKRWQEMLDPANLTL